MKKTLASFPARLTLGTVLWATLGIAVAQAQPAVLPPPVVAAAVANNADPLPTDLKIVALRERALTDDTAFDIVEGLTTEIGPRQGGTEAEARARSWAVERLKAMGFANVHVEPFEMPVWQRGAESAAVVSPFPQPLRIIGLANSGATPPGGLTLPVAYFASYNELLLAPAGSLVGRIAYVSNTMQPAQDGTSYGAEGRARFVGPSAAASRGAAAILIRSIGTDHGSAPHTGMTTFAPGVTPIPAAALSVTDAANLERMLRRAKGRNQPVTVHLILDDHPVGTRTSGNVVAEVPGTDPGAGVIVVGGHLDSWDVGTGAVDDGAGVAVTAAAARLVMAASKPRRTIRVVWFGAEETGGHGGTAYATAHAGERFAMAAESDSGADRVWRFSTTFADTLKALDDRLTTALAPLGITHRVGPGNGGTDVSALLKGGAAGVALDQSMLRYFDIHHTAEDTLERVDPAQLRQNVAAWATVLKIMADAPEELVGRGIEPKP